jgi:hypothetical protein
MSLQRRQGIGVALAGAAGEHKIDDAVSTNL